MTWIDKGTILIFNSYESELEQLAELTGYQETRIKWVLEAFSNTQAKKDAIKDAKEYVNEHNESRSPWIKRIREYWERKAPLGASEIPNSFKPKGNKSSYLSVPTTKRVRTTRVQSSPMGNTNKRRRNYVPDNSSDSGQGSIIEKMKKHQDYVG